MIMSLTSSNGSHLETPSDDSNNAGEINEVKYKQRIMIFQF